MAISIFTIYKLIIVNKVFIPCIIWRIYIDNINLPFMRISKSSQCFKVISLNKDMVGGILYLC